MQLLPKNRALRILVGVLYALLAAVLIFLFFKYAFVWFLPFVLAYMLASLLNPIVKYLERRTKIPRRAASGITVLSFIGVFGGLIYWIVSKMVQELISLKNLQIDISSIFEKVSDFFLKLKEFFNTLPVDFSNVLENFENALTNLVNDITSKLPDMAISFATTFVQVLPSVLVFIVVMMVAAYYFSADLTLVNRFLKHQLPDKFAESVAVTAQKLFRTLGKLAKAYLFFMLLTFCELTLGLSLIGIDYAIVLSALIAFIDILPVLGVGTVLIPWSIISMFQGSVGKGVALLVLYIFITAVRQTLEPKIIGRQLGLHPLVTLISMYVGLQIFGIIGMFICPMLMMLLKYVQESTGIRLWKPLPPEDRPPESESKPHRTVAEILRELPKKLAELWRKLQSFDYAGWFRRVRHRLRRKKNPPSVPPEQKSDPKKKP